MGDQWFPGERQPEEKSVAIGLDNGSKVAVIGGGPAGSFFSYFVLDFAKRAGLEIQVDIYEPRDFSISGPGSCNMCGGIISETLVQNLAADGINLPPTIIQRGIDSYHLHTDQGSVLIPTPLEEKRIGAIHRGSGPRDIKEMKWGSFDGHLLSLAEEKGANVIHERVSETGFQSGRPKVKTRKGEFQTYDLLAVGAGINSAITKQFGKLGIGYNPPEGTKTYISEYFMGSDKIEEILGNSMHVFLLAIPRLEFAAIIPKGDYVTVCMLGEDIDKELIATFLNSPEVKQCMPQDWSPGENSCQCSPRINIKGAENPYNDRIIFIGDCGVTRLFKDGIGAAYRIAKAAASTAVFQGISKNDFNKHFWPANTRIIFDNSIGKLSFFVIDRIKGLGFARRALVRMTAKEQEKPGRAKRMSTVMWDMFTGSAPYKEIFLRMLHPAFLINFGWSIMVSFFHQE